MIKRANNIKQLSNPISTGGGGHSFENKIQALFLLFMLIDSPPPGGKQNVKIIEILLQCKDRGYETDDLVVILEDKHKTSPSSKHQMLCSIKRSIVFSKSNQALQNAISSFWRDYTNHKKFNVNKDCLVLITGLLNQADTKSVRQVLQRVHNHHDSVEFYTQLNTKLYVGDEERNVIEVFEHHLKKANNENIVSNNDVFKFLKITYVFSCDLDTNPGIVRSLVNANIYMATEIDPELLWPRLIEEVQRFNECPAPITRDTIALEINDYFVIRKSEFKQDTPIKNIESFIVDMDENLIKTLALANMIGSWDDNNQFDKDIISKFTNEDYNTWIDKIKNICTIQSNLISIKNDIWHIQSRLELWKSLGKYIFKENLDMFSNVFIDIFKLTNSEFNIPIEKRIISLGSNCSDYIRSNTAITLAIIGNNSKELINCIPSYAVNTAKRLVNTTLCNASWKRWATLNPLLPDFAEASPLTFINCIETALDCDNSPFIELFNQEGKGLLSPNYLTGLYCALEAIAWDEKYFIHAINILAKLASIDPGGNYANRPINSLVEILIPWRNHTFASIEFKICGLKSIYINHPDIIWQVLIRLLPDMKTYSTKCYIPRWQNVPPDLYHNNEIPPNYTEQNNKYCELIVDIAIKDVSRLIQILTHIDHLSFLSLNKLLDFIGSSKVNNYSLKDKYSIYERLIEFISVNKRYPEANRRLGEEVVERLCGVANKLQPKNPLLLYLRLFNHNDFELLGFEAENLIELQQKRNNAIQEILNFDGWNSLVKLIENSNNLQEIARVLSLCQHEEYEVNIIPKLLSDTNEKHLQFSKMYIKYKFRDCGWEWVNKFSFNNWRSDEIGSFLSCIPLCNRLLEYVDLHLKTNEHLFWSNIENVMYSDLKSKFLINQLIKYDRIELCILYIGLCYESINDKNWIAKRMIKLVPKYKLNLHYQLLEIVKKLQQEEFVENDLLEKLEWIIFPLLNNGYYGVRPITLEKKLSRDPIYFCEILKMTYYSEKKDINDKIFDEKIIERAWSLLQNWRIVPGVDDGKFNGNRFNAWIKKVKKIAEETGYLNVALSAIGKVLIYAPKDKKNELWLKCIIACLDEQSHEELRNGFCQALYNSRGMHLIDKSGASERVIADKYFLLAKKLTTLGFLRVARSIQSLVETYLQEEEQVIYNYRD